MQCGSCFEQLRQERRILIFCRPVFLTFWNERCLLYEANMPYTLCRAIQLLPRTLSILNSDQQWQRWSRKVWEKVSVPDSWSWASSRDQKSRGGETGVGILSLPADKIYFTYYTRSQNKGCGSKSYSMLRIISSFCQAFKSSAYLADYQTALR